MLNPLPPVLALAVRLTYEGYEVRSLYASLGMEYVFLSHLSRPIVEALADPGTTPEYAPWTDNSGGVRLWGCLATFRVDGIEVRCGIDAEGGAELAPAEPETKP